MFYWPFQGGTSFVDLLCFCSVLCLLCFVRVCLYVLRGHLLGKGWPLGSPLWCLLWVCHFPIGVLGQVWYLIVLIPDLCNLTYFHTVDYRQFTWYIVIITNTFKYLLWKRKVNDRRKIQKNLIIASVNWPFHHFHSGYLQTVTLTNSEDPDEMEHNVVFHPGLHCLQNFHKNKSSRQKCIIIQNFYPWPLKIQNGWFHLPMLSICPGNPSERKG